MTLALRLLRGYVGATSEPQNLVGLFNGRDASNVYAIGRLTSSDGGATWSKYASNPVLIKSSGWESTWVAQPSMLWDGSQYVVYYTGNDGTHNRTGRATSPDGIAWTKYGSNPVLGYGSAGSFDENGAYIPFVLHDPSWSPAWKMWYTGQKSTATWTVAFADSTDGLTWTKRGVVISPGTGWEGSGVATAGVFYRGGTFYVYYVGLDGSSHWHPGLATCTDPANSATYTKQGELGGLSGNVTFGGVTYQSNGPTQILPYGAGYTVLGTAFHPTVGTTEVSFLSSTTDLLNFTAPTGPIVALGAGGAWDEKSAENPSAIYLP